MQASSRHPRPARAERSHRTGGRGLLTGTAATLAAAALYNTWQARKAERRHPPAGRFLTVDGVRLHILDRGAGPAIVLLHGNVVTAEDFVLSGLFDRLAEHHRVVAFDRPGYGHSGRPRGRVWTVQRQAELLWHACDRLGLERPVIAGHSLGALVALAMAAQRPARLRGLAVLSGYYYAGVRLDVPAMLPLAVPGLGDALRYTVTPLLGRLLLPGTLRAMFAPLPVPERFDAGFPHAFPVRPWQLRAEAVDAADMLPAAAALADGYADLGVPLCVVAGTEDGVVDSETQGGRLARAVPGARLLLVRGAGHMVHHAAPDAIGRAIARLAVESRAERGAERAAPAAAPPLPAAVT